MTLRFCEFLLIIISLPLKRIHYSGRIATLSAKASTSLTTLQREILRFVIIIASMAFAVAVLLVILWAAWYVIVFSCNKKCNSIQASSRVSDLYQCAESPY